GRADVLLVCLRLSVRLCGPADCGALGGGDRRSGAIRALALPFFSALQRSPAASTKGGGKLNAQRSEAATAPARPRPWRGVLARRSGGHARQRAGRGTGGKLARLAGARGCACGPRGLGQDASF